MCRRDRPPHEAAIPTMPSHNAAAMKVSVAAVTLCCAVHVAAFAPPPRFGVSLGHPSSGWNPEQVDRRPCRRGPRLAMKFDEDTSGFDPMGFSSAEQRRRGGGKGALRAIKIGMDEKHAVLDQQQGQQNGDASTTEVPPLSTAAVQGWDYWKYRALLLGVALLWGTNFPAVCSLL